MQIANDEIKLPDATPLFVNAYSVTLNPYFSRIAVGDLYTGDVKDTRWRAVIVIPTIDLRAFAELIMKLAEQTEAMAESGGATKQ